MFNVATIYAMKRAVINGEPLTERIITCAGNKNTLSGNFWIRIGTPIEYFLDFQLSYSPLDTIVYLGGSFMGSTIIDFNTSILKNKNCILIESKNLIYTKNIEYPCIRCGNCVEVCPVNLLPQQLYFYSKNKDHKKTKNHYILDCLECKVCEKVCPSNIPLVKYFHIEKKIQYKLNLINIRKKESVKRFDMREQRLLKEKNDFLLKNSSKKLLDRKQQIQEAIQRIRNKK